MATVKKKPSVWKKIKRTFKKIGLSIMEFFENQYKKFMSLKDYVRYIIYVWTGIVVLLIILVAISASNSKFRADYKKIEDSINKAALLYVEKNEIYSLKTNKLELSMDMLRDYGYLREEDITDKTCIGYAKVYFEEEKNSENDGKYVSNAYIKCKKYVSEDYSENK